MTTEIESSTETESASPALEAIRHELNAVHPADFARDNFDVPHAALAVLARSRKLQVFASELAALPDFRVEAIHKLDTYAQAALDTDIAYRAAVRPPEDAEALARELVERRALLRSAVRPLMHRNLVDETRLKELRGTRGYKNLIFDTKLLVRLMRETWPRISGRSPVTETELNDAQFLSERLLNLVVGSDEQRKHIVEANRLRLAALTLFLDAYQEVRDGIIFLRRRHGDAEQIAPSLHAQSKRPASKRKAGTKRDDPEHEPPITDEPVAPARTS